MNTIKSETSNSKLTVDYENSTNTVTIHVGNETGFRFVDLDIDKTEYLLDILTEFKNMIV